MPYFVRLFFASPDSWHMTLIGIFETFRVPMCRLEALQHYVMAMMSRGGRWQAFRKERPLPPRPGKTGSIRMRMQAAGDPPVRKDSRAVSRAAGAGIIMRWAARSSRPRPRR